MLLPEPHFTLTDGQRLGVEGWEKGPQANGLGNKQPWALALIPEKMDFRMKLTRRDLETVASYSLKKQPSRGYCNSKHLRTKHRHIQFHKTNAIRYKTTD